MAANGDTSTVKRKSGTDKNIGQPKPSKGGTTKGGKVNC